jgi:hypothetical protein
MYGTCSKAIEPTNREPRCARRSDDTDAIAGAASGPLSVGWIVLQAATPCSLLNCCHPRLVNAHR